MLFLIVLCFRLRQLVGNSILFASEEATTATWCGYPGRPCIRCTDKIAGYDDALKCADRMMTSSLASTTSLLGKYVTAEWPDSMILNLLATCMNCDTIYQCIYQILKRS